MRQRYFFIGELLVAFAFTLSGELSGRTLLTCTGTLILGFALGGFDPCCDAN